MKDQYLKCALEINRMVTRNYNSKLYAATSLLHPSLRHHIYALCSYIEVVEEVVRSSREGERERLFEEMCSELYRTLDRGISSNPIVYSFTQVAEHCRIDIGLINSLVEGLRSDLLQAGRGAESWAATAGLMALKVFTREHPTLYPSLKTAAASLGVAFQQIQWLETIHREESRLYNHYFPQFALTQFNPESKRAIVQEIEQRMVQGKRATAQLPEECRMGVQALYNHYDRRLQELKTAPIDYPAHLGSGQKAYLMLKCVCHTPPWREGACHK